MNTKIEDVIRTALRQASAITAVDGQHSVRQTLLVAHQLYDAMLLLEPSDRARRIRLIDAVFRPSAQGSEHGRRHR